MQKCRNLIKNAISEASNIDIKKIENIESQRRLLQLYEFVDNEINKIKRHVGDIYEDLLKDETNLEREIEIFSDRINHEYDSENVNVLHDNFHYFKKNCDSDNLVNRL